MNRLRILLLPFSLIYFLVTEARNYLYGRGLIPSFHFEVFTINIGNLTLGGTGKTPMTEYLIRSFISKWTVATLSRGYGRSTKGFRLAESQDSPQTIGDEPFQLYAKFKESILVTVCESRAEAIPEILMHQLKTDLVLLDDAFQHRKIRCDLNILLCDFNRPFYKDYLLPAGNLRESSINAARADMVVVTKCPSHLSGNEYGLITGQIQRFAGSEKPVFFTQIRYDEPVMFDGRKMINSSVILISGLADSSPLKQYVAKQFTLISEKDLNDHHHYSEREIELWENQAGKSGCLLLTTEKDYVKISQLPFAQDLWAYLPIKTEFLQNEARFLELVEASYKAKYGLQAG